MVKKCCILLIEGWVSCCLQRRPMLYLIHQIAQNVTGRLGAVVDVARGVRNPRDPRTSKLGNHKLEIFQRVD